MAAQAFADQLKQRRETARLSITELASLAHVTEAYLRQLESGKRTKPSAYLVCKLAEVLHLSCEQRTSFYQAAEVEQQIEQIELKSEELATKRLDLAKIYWSMPAESRTIPNFLQELKTRHDMVLDHQVVKRMLEMCERLGYVQHHVWAGADDLPSRDASREQKLLRKFRLKHAIVARCPEVIWSKNYRDEYAKTDMQTDNQVHRWLGKMAAPLLLAILRKGDRVAVGSGRGPYECVCAAENRVHRSFADLDEIMSLTGSMGVQPWDATLGDPCLDADGIAQKLAGFLYSPELTTSLVKAGLFDRETSGVPKHLTNWTSGKMPNVAVVGIGALAGGHRLCSDDIRHQQKRQVVAELDGLIQIAKKIDGLFTSSGDEYHCVADLANYLVTVPAPFPEMVPSDDWNELKARVERVNRYVIAPKPGELAEVAKNGVVIAVAGGTFKRHAIRHILLQEVRVSHLVCDDRTADWLLQCKSTSSSPVGAWDAAGV
jgi:DNA-binding transcriptional regulator LsrR (DeoR family)/DNA-binding XRE family transcriptional regulator